MNAIIFLEQYKEAMRRIRWLEVELEEERIMIDAVRSLSDNDGLPHGNNISRPTEDKAIRLADKSLRLIEAKREAIRIRQDVFDTVIAIGGLESDVLLERYVYLKAWSDVCESVAFTWPTVRAAWHRGLDMVQSIIDTRYYI